MSKYHVAINGLTLFLTNPLDQYEPLSNYIAVSVGAVPMQQKGGNTIRLLGSKRTLAWQGGIWIRRPNGLQTRLFCHCKTRKAPFFTYPEAVEWDGSLLGLYPTQKALEAFGTVEGIAKWLNAIDWEELGVLHAGRYNFTQRQLTNLVVPV